MSRTVTEHEMKRRTAMAKAQAHLCDAFSVITEQEPLTAVEWIQVLLTAQQRMLAIALKEEWEVTE
jgi:hypothetical protein